MKKPRPRELGHLWASQAEDDVIDVVIVGSGYGGSVAAAGLAGLVGDDPDTGLRRRQRVVVLERGRHWRPGEFPSRLSDLPGHVRLVKQSTGQVAGNPEGLFDVRMGDDVMALLGNGLGGGSLINAGVMLEPGDADFVNDRLPTWRELRNDLAKGHYFERAQRALGGFTTRDGEEVDNSIECHQDAGTTLAKTMAHAELRASAPKDRAGRSTAGERRLPPLTVAMEAGPNQAGVILKRCTLCGDCLTGCNAGAKNSLDVNLLVEAQRKGAEIYIGASVISLKHEPRKQDDAQWVLRVAHTSPTLQAREKGLLYLRARRVILAAGSLGSTEILLRSRDDRLCFSPKLGENFSCNGDNIAAVYRMKTLVRGSANEDVAPEKRCVGPTITATFRLDANEPRSPQVQEFAVPAPLKRLLDEVVTTAHALYRLPEADRTPHGAEEPVDPLAVNKEHIEHTLVVGLIGHDDAAGSLRLPQPMRPREGPPQTGTLCIHWPQARYAPVLDEPHQRLDEMVQSWKSEARLVANPVWRLLPKELEKMVSQPRGPVLTVHPLGGCALAGSVADGVVDRCGRVFDARPQCDIAAARAAGAPADCGWFGSLVVLDGAILPGSLGVNPALTITALALHAIDTLRVDWGLHEAAAPAAQRQRRPEERPRLHPPEQAPAVPAQVETEFEIIERLGGPVCLDIGEGQPRQCQVELTLAYKSVKLGTLLEPLKRRVPVDEQHPETRLRIYDRTAWERENLRVQGDAQRAQYLLYEARLRGHLCFLHRDVSSYRQRAWRAFWAWLLNRGMRDLVQEWRARKPSDPQGIKGLGSKLGRVGEGLRALRALLKQATRAGEVRLFEYALTVGDVLLDKLGKGAGAPPSWLKREIRGRKRLTYGLRANPWQQLTQLRLQAMPGMQHGADAVLELDTGFMAGIGVPLLRVSRQRDHATALADLASFGLLLTRVLLYTHLWTFRKPDTPSAASPRRLPGKVAGDLPQVTELVVDRIRGTDTPVKIRLSRYAPEPKPKPKPDAEAERKREKPSLLMVHGYSASGTTFTHETLDPSAAEYFYREGRDVWVLDLRSSAGMPTARHPWSFEDAALIDIPAALLHIKAVTGRKVDVLAHCIGASMLGMAILADANEVRSNEQQLGPDTWLTREQLGQLAVFNGRPDGDAHPCINSIVMTQKGPLLRYTDANVLRAYLLGSIRRLLFSDDYQFRPPAEPSVTDEMLDRILSSLPYPKADYDTENPRWPWATTGWTGTRHRMDALYGRVFSAANLRSQTLDAIDDLFGPLNLDTVSQTMHFARFRAITNQAGRGEFVTRGRLRQRWGGIPTFALHGDENGMTDGDTLHLLRDSLGPAGVPFMGKPYPGIGHQDSLIGVHAESVFADIERFLDKGLLAEIEGAWTSVPHNQPGWAFDAPWIGPRLVVPESAPDSLRVAVMPRPDQGRAQFLLLPGRYDDTADDTSPCYEPGEEAPVAQGDLGASGEWLFAPVPAWHAADAPGAIHGWFAVLAYDLDEAMGVEHAGAIASGGAPHRRPRRASLRRPTFGGNGAAALAQQGRASEAGPAPAPRLVPAPLPKWAEGEPRLVEAAAWLRGCTDAELDECFVRLADLQRAELQSRAGHPKVPFAFTVGSCQYPHGLIDRSLASASMQAMVDGLDAETSLALLLGDQIYADATAGLLDATRPDERYDQPYDRALQVPALRALMRRVPVQILPDDHELVDNWEPFAPQVRESWARAARARDEARTLGLDAFHKYQRPKKRQACSPDDIASRRAGFRRDPKPPPPADLKFSHAGYPFFLLDTRTRRSARGSTLAADEANIIDDKQWLRLQLWLCAHAHEVKFVATGSLLLPRRRANAAQSIASERSDTWDGFPNSLHRLLAFLAYNDIRRTVFLSGDEHHSLLAEATLGNVKLVSIHASALYAPYPFANGRPQDFVEKDDFEVPGAGKFHVETRFAAPGDGYARIEVLPGARLLVSFQKSADTAPDPALEVALDRPPRLKRSAPRS